MKLGTWQFAGLFTVAILGANHVSGEEWMRYFTYYGSWGTIGVVLTIIAITYLSSKLVRIIHSLHIRSVPELFHLFFGQLLSPVFTFLFYCITVGFSAFILHEQVNQLFSLAGIPAIFIIILFLCILLLVAFASIQQLKRTALVGVFLMFTYLLLFFSKQLHIQFPSFAYQFNFWWLIRALFYIASHVTLSLVIIIPLASRVSDVRVAVKGVWVGGVFFALFALLSHFVLLANWHDVNSSKQPFYFLSTNLIPGGSYLFLGISTLFSLLYLSIWTESLAYMTAQKLDINKRPLQLLFVLCIVVISVLYTLSLWVGLFTQIATVYFGLFFLLFFVRFMGRTSPK